MNRREFLHGTAALAALAACPPSLGALGGRPNKEGYGALSPVPDRVRNETILDLPKDFRYVALAAAGDKMRDGFANPAGPRQLGCLRLNGQTYVARNHVGHGDATIGPEANSYRPATPGGVVCMILENGTNELVRDWCLISGIALPVAGTATPWGTWLAADEEGSIFESRIQQRELKAPTALRPFAGVALSQMAYDGQSHCLFAVDVKGARLLRWVPKSIPDLAAGGIAQELSLAAWQSAGCTGKWVPTGEGSVASQHTIRAIMPHDGALLLLTSGSKTGTTDLWQLAAPQRMASNLRRLQTIALEPASITQACATPGGGIVVAAGNRVIGFQIGQKPFDLARTSSPKTVVTGLDFSLDGSTLVANLDGPGILVAISGPWENGPL
ncbi:MAG: hypothetical protein HONBIEJF_02782 [Fimbriimonadaceae bacterium]|nr:hypothetical protein [Fimbriimonadaceae bacterium]